MQTRWGKQIGFACLSMFLALMVTIPAQAAPSDTTLIQSLDVTTDVFATSAPGEDFTLVLIPDPQNESQYHVDMFIAQTNWIVANKDSSSIAFVTTAGDTVNTSSSNTQYQNADSAIDILDAGGVWHTVAPGNHDNPGVPPGTLRYPTYFGVSRYADREVVDGYWFGGFYDHYNTYSLFSAGGMDFILINLQYSPTTDILNWADALLTTYSDRRAIVEQHNILNVDNSWNNQGSYLALKDHSNLFLMLCGHMHTSLDGAAYRGEAGDDGHTIHIVQADYQEMNFGNGYLRLLRFSPANDMIYMTTYSPYTGESIATWPDQMDLAYDMHHDLTVAVEGNGMTAPAAGDHSYAAGTVVDVIATPAPGWHLDHWSGVCTGSGTCQVMMDADKSVTATFVENASICYALTLDHTGQGSDPVASPANSAGCPADQYVAGENIHLNNAVPDVGWHISGWSGTANDSSTVSTNSLTMPAGTYTAAVIYSQDEYALTIVSAHGIVTKSPDQAAYHYGDEVTLSVTTDPDWTFTGWSGDCSGVATCVVTMNADRSVTAAFVADPLPRVFSIVRVSANPASAASVDFMVTFSEPVAGVDTTAPFDDFSLTTTGGTDASITEVSGSDATWTITVNTGSGNGTIRLDVPGTATIADLTGNSLENLPFTEGQVYTVVKTPVMGAGMYDDTHAALLYSSSWSTWSGTGPHANTMHYTNASGAMASFVFQAPARFILFFQKYSNRSNILVSVDGGTAVPVSAYNSSGLWQQTYASSMYSDAGVHIVTISTPEDGKYIDIDAIQIVGPPAPLGVGMYDDANAAWAYTGSWSTWSGSGPYSNTMHYTNETGATASFMFQAPAKFTLFFQKASNRSSILISVDGGTPVPVGAYSSSSHWQQTYTSEMYTDSNSHTITISTPGDGKYIDIDAIQIVGPPAPLSVGMYDDTNAAWTYTGSWSTWSGSGPYANTMHYTNASGAAASFMFQAPARFILSFQTAANRSNILISVDGGAAIPVNAYSSSGLWRQMYTSAMYSDTGSHTVVVSTPGDGKYIDIDAIQIMGAPTPQGVGMYNDSHAAWTYSGSWSTWSGSGPYGSAMHYSNATGATATFTFQGPARFTLYFQKYSNRSNILISVDGGTAVPIDAYSLTNLWQQTYTSVMYSDSGSHTVTISTPGDGKYIDVDAIEIQSP